MRFTLFALPTALLASVASGHTVDCWGKALHPPVESVDYVTYLMDQVALGDLHHLPGYADTKSLYLDAQECKELACFKGVQADSPRKLLMQNVIDGVRVLRRECRDVLDDVDVAGGVLYQPDNWDIILQQEDSCKDEE